MNFEVVKAEPATAIKLAAPIALVFPGQGVQQPGMARKLYDRYAVAREIFARAERVLDLPLQRLCFEGPVEELNRTSNLQPAVLTACWAASEVYRSSQGMAGVRVSAGHSLGEFAALAASGALSWEEALRIVRERGRLMEQAAGEQPGAMLAIVGLEEPKIEEIRAEAGREGPIWVANRNSDSQFVLSGAPAAVARAEKLALASGARRALILTIPLAAHTPLMEKAAGRFQQLVERLPLRAPRIPVLSNAAGEALATAEAVRDELVNHLLRPVDWARIMLSMQVLRVRTVVELGPGRVLASLAAKHIPDVQTWNADELFVDYAPAS